MAIPGFFEPWDGGRGGVGEEEGSRAFRLSWGWGRGGYVGELKLSVPFPNAMAVLF